MTNSKNIFVKTLKILSETVLIFNMIGAILLSVLIIAGGVIEKEMPLLIIISVGIAIIQFVGCGFALVKLVGDAKKTLKHIGIVAGIIMISIIIIMGCFVVASFYAYDPNDIGYDDVEDDISYPEYGVTFIFHNLEYAEQDEYLYFFDQDNKFFEIVDVYRTEEITTYTKTYSVQSKTLGEDIKAEVDLKENEETIIYVDYLERTITVETKTVEE